MRSYTALFKLIFVLAFVQAWSRSVLYVNTSPQQLLRTSRLRTCCVVCELSELSTAYDECPSLTVSVCKQKLDWDTKQAGAPVQKKEEILRIKTEIDKARAVLQNYKVELRELDSQDLEVYQPKAKAHQNMLDEMTRNLNFVKSSVEKEDLMSGGTKKDEELDKKSAKELIEMAQKTQEQDKEGVKRMQQMVQDSEAIGIATNIKLKMQTEQIKNVQVDVATVQVCVCVCVCVHKHGFTRKQTHTHPHIVSENDGGKDILSPLLVI